MNAAEARERFSAAYEGELPDGERAQFEAALEQDAALSAEYDAFRTTMKAMGQALGSSDAVPPPDLLGGVQRTLRARSKGRFYRDRFSMLEPRQQGLWVSLCLIVLVLFLVIWGAFQYVRFD